MKRTLAFLNHLQMVRHEQRGLQSFEYRLVIYARIGIVDESARFHITVGVYMQIPAPARDAAIGVFAVVPEVHRE